MKRVRQFLIKLLESTEDDLSGEDQKILVQLPDPGKRATLWELTNNHVYHLSLGVNALHIRIGRVEAKVGLMLALIFGIFGLAAKPVIESVVNTALKGLF